MLLQPELSACTRGGDGFIWVIGDSVARGLALDILQILQPGLSPDEVHHASVRLLHRGYCTAAL